MGNLLSHPFSSVEEEPFLNNIILLLNPTQVSPRVLHDNFSSLDCVGILIEAVLESSEDGTDLDLFYMLVALKKQAFDLIEIKLARVTGGRLLLLDCYFI